MVPKISPATLQERRREVMSRLGPDAAILLPAAPEAVRSNDVHHPYRAANDLVYLSGFDEPEAVALLLPGHPEHEFVLFVRPRDPERELWDGRRAGVEGAKRDFGATAAFSVAEIDARLPALLGERNRLFFRFGADTAWNDRVVAWMRRWQSERPRTGRGPSVLADPAEILHELRLRKEAEEVACLRRASAVAAQAHREALCQTRVGMFEYEVEALLAGSFRRQGAVGPAYPSIVASGANATVLHYVNNDCRIADGDLLLVDAGAEWGHYCSDITRTFPVQGRYRPEQRQVYELVLRAQKAAIDAVRPGVRHDLPHEHAVEVLVAGLLELGLLSGGREEVMEKGTYRSFFMHRTSHWLGMDVHDVGSYVVNGSPRSLEAGMVLTVEPGLYIGVDREDVPEGFRGIGVRIEDDVVVTASGAEVLTDGAPKEWGEMLTLCGDKAGVG